MKVLIYKRTHIDDPDQYGCFGIEDCLGKVRNYDFEAVIGIGGISSEPYKINKKISWVGIYPKKINCNSLNGPIIIFKKFINYRTEGKLLEEIAPLLYKRFFEVNTRILINGISEEENMEAQIIIKDANKEAKVNNVESLIKIAKKRCKQIKSSQKCKNNLC